jgi:hypothetical protein
MYGFSDVKLALAIGANRVLLATPFIVRNSIAVPNAFLSYISEGKCKISFSTGANLPG